MKKRDVCVFPWTGRRAGDFELFMLLPDENGGKRYIRLFQKDGYLVFQSIFA